MGFYVLFYTLVSIPAVTNLIKDRIARELTLFLGGEILIHDINIYPFNEVQIKGLEVYDNMGQRCLEVETIGAGIRLWKLIMEGNIEFTYGEIIGLNAEIIQEEKDAPLNIDFILKAFAPKKDNNEKKAFDLALHNVVLRKSSVSFLRPWLKNKKIGELDLSSLQVSNLAADISFPKISDKGIDVDLRRLSMFLPGLVDVETIKFKGSFNNEGIHVSDFTFILPGSRLFIPEINVPLKEEEDLKTIMSKGTHYVEIQNSYLSPSDFSFLWKPLEQLTAPLDFSLFLSGNLNKIQLEKFNFGNPSDIMVSFNATGEGATDIQTAKGNISNLHVFVSNSVFKIINDNISRVPPLLHSLLNVIGDFNLRGNISAAMANKEVKGDIEILSEAFNMNLEGAMHESSAKSLEVNGEINIEKLRLHEIVTKSPVSDINCHIIAEGTVKGKDSQGMLSLAIDNFSMNGKMYDGLSLNIDKTEQLIDADLWMNNDIADISAKFTGDIFSYTKNLNFDCDIKKLDLSELVDMKAYKDYLIAGNINLDAEGHSFNDIKGNLFLNKFSFAAPDNSKKLRLNQLTVSADEVDSTRTVLLKSDWLDARFDGELAPKEIGEQIVKLAESVMPVFIPEKPHKEFDTPVNMDFDIVIHNNNSLTEFFNLPFRLLVPVSITGNIESLSNSASLVLDIPYLQQGRDKLIYDSRLKLNVDGNSGILDALIETTLPVKNGDLALNVNVYGQSNEISTDFRWVNTINSDFKGRFTLNTEISKNELTNTPSFSVNIRPSVLQMGTVDWYVDPCNITYNDRYLTIDGLKIWNEGQFVEITGVASPEYSDVLNVMLENIDVDYVFDMLQINYVTFGGSATGQVSGHALLSGDPVAETEYFQINNFSYNHTPLGFCLVTSKWNNEEKEIEISADISHEGHRRVLGSGGIWITRDSLSFDINADKVPVDFVQPFMEVFSSHVGGFATGNVKLFGTFHDIDMTGKIFADSVAVKLDYTNTIYHGSDSVFLNPGQIDIPKFRLYDKFGNSALLTGELTHRYFHDPSFTFRLSEADNFLCYDTSADLNPDWYGTLFGTGSAYLRGVPGIVDISADMTVSGNSSFTFVLNDTQYAQDYQFLTFSDKKAEEKKKQAASLTVDDIKEMLKKNMVKDEGSLSIFGIDIRATVTPQALFTLVMDPSAGDKITARGRGAMQIKYSSDNDEMMMYGKYEIDEGNYNFSLQDIILRDFKIKEGSYISFNGNPLTADLDISATYRVNTNLSDLDKSFSTDRDLNRTNVPVDAVLSVNGNMQQPDITFDIELPTLTQDVERKVKSIISTDDMMNRQIIYLLALNRFYTPEYMGSTGNGGELAAVASTTISSQLSNILGQLTDKFSVSPSFRSDKGDFSDIEVDVALSSRLLNNRLLINGNFGYRDRSNSSTTFVGDFDVEYLLSKNGNLRLKAYNHFNDQNYYLREALTTQGLGIVYRRDFDDWFTFLRKKKLMTKEEKKEESEETDNVEKQENGEILKNGSEN